MTRTSRGFSLLEVIVAVAILGLGLTTILSAQAGLFSSSLRGANMTRASNLARCKMSELEVKLLRDGFPIADEKESGHCCEDEDDDGFECSWMVETIILPELGSLDGGVDASDLTLDAGLGGPTTGGLQLDAGIDPDSTGLGSLAAFGQGMSAMGLEEGSASGLMGAGASFSGIAAMAMTMIYPSIKPMFEASIRRVMVTVKWKEGISERTFEVGQYLTNPQQGGMVPGLPGYDPELAAEQSAPASSAEPASSDKKSGKTKTNKGGKKGK